MEFKNLKIGMKVYSYRYGQDSYYDKRFGYDILEVIKLEKDKVWLKYCNSDTSFELAKDNFEIFEEYNEYTEELLSEIKRNITEDWENAGYEDATFRYENCNESFLNGVIKAINEIKEKRRNE